MVDKKANFLVEVLELMPDDSVFVFDGVDNELTTELEIAGYSATETHAFEIRIADKSKLLELIQFKHLYRRITHFFIMSGQEYLLQAYDHMMSTWLSNKISVTQSFINRYALEPDGEFWLVGEFPEMDD
ncbi:hypothetical protein [Hymenobacter sp. DG25A]|uniref:hypothetical protein n=1 Tax=Hymenobacter sp. DG25A TaxID=1385663 RepID=UPI0006BDCF19|nr:hypothetical protein [Hymenobacter sp. DG25A]ALD21954.1 hypothetical protein AM218_12980 [Hymenobacter sp. DG25A]